MPNAAGYESFGYRGGNAWGWRSAGWAGQSEAGDAPRSAWSDPGFTGAGGWLDPLRSWVGTSRKRAILVTVLGFILWWPVGLAILFYMVGSGRMRRVRRQTGDYQAWQASNEASGSAWNATSSSGNQAFDAYRAETLRRMEEEQQEFAAFVERLRFARDKAEFERFMAERRSGPAPSDGQSAA